MRESESSFNNEKRIKITNLNNYDQESVMVYGINAETESDRPSVSGNNFLGKQQQQNSQAFLEVRNLATRAKLREQTTELDTSEFE